MVYDDINDYIGYLGIGGQSPLTVPHYGLNAKSSLLTRALNEMVKFGVSFGARKITFSGGIKDNRAIR